MGLKINAKEYFSPRFLQALNQYNDAEALGKLRSEYTIYRRQRGKGPLVKDEIIWLWNLVSAFGESRKIIEAVKYDSDTVRTTELNISELFEELGNRIQSKKRGIDFYNNRTEFLNIFGQVTAYNFSDAEWDELQRKINVLRSAIQNSTVLSQDHKRRLLMKLEAMQAELHKRTTNLDQFAALIFQVSVMSHKFGEAVKPIVEPLSEISKIVLRVVGIVEGVELLEHGGNPKDLLEFTNDKAD